MKRRKKKGKGRRDGGSVEAEEGRGEKEGRRMERLVLGG